MHHHPLESSQTGWSGTNVSGDRSHLTNYGMFLQALFASTRNTNWIDWDNFLLIFFYIFNVYLLFLRKAETEPEWGRGRERETQNSKQAPGSCCQHRAWHRAGTHRTVRSWPELKSDAQPTEPPRCPEIISFLFENHQKAFTIHIEFASSCSLYRVEPRWDFDIISHCQFYS